ncbi:MAG: hypothetical protein ACFFE2_11270 [Candidatus Thorarchaeota archaeon]
MDQLGEYMDIHKKLLPHAVVHLFFRGLEQKGDVKSYCNGANESGRWIFQIFNREFVDELAQTISRILVWRKRRPVLEVMSGDGRLTEYIRPLIKRRCIATDSKDGRYNIGYPKWVETLEAMEAVSKYKPSIVIICWEPYLSTVGIDIVKTGVPTAWIGNPAMCGHTDIFDQPHIPLESRYALSRHDYFTARDFKTDVFFFNCKPEWV